MDYEKYISPELLVLIPVLYAIGMGLKKSKVKNKDIPAILGMVSVLLASIWIFANSTVTGFADVLLCIFSSITQGILLSAASVYVNQLYTQNKKSN